MMVPGEEAEANDWKLRRFKTNIGKFEDSNNGYHFDWEHPEKLLGLLVGMVFGEEEYIASDGSNRFSTKPVRLETMETIKDGDFEMPAVKYLDQNPNAKPSMITTLWTFLTMWTENRFRLTFNHGHF